MLHMVNKYIAVCCLLAGLLACQAGSTVATPLAIKEVDSMTTIANTQTQTPRKEVRGGQLLVNSRLIDTWLLTDGDIVVPVGWHGAGNATWAYTQGKVRVTAVSDASIWQPVWLPDHDKPVTCVVKVVADIDRPKPQPDTAPAQPSMAAASLAIQVLAADSDPRPVLLTSTWSGYQLSQHTYSVTGIVPAGVKQVVVQVLMHNLPGIWLDDISFICNGLTFSPIVVPAPSGTIEFEDRNEP